MNKRGKLSFPAIIIIALLCITVLIALLVLRTAVFSQNDHSPRIYKNISYSNLALCEESDWTYRLEPVDCPLSEKQIKKWSLIGNCWKGVDHTLTEEITCEFNSQSCLSYNYSVWGECLQSGTQSRSVISSYPLGCQGNPVLSQQCNYIPLCTENDWNYTLNPKICPKSEEQTKTWTKIGNCEYGVNHSSSEIINCDYNAPVCTSYNYSVWGECLQSGTQSRSVISSYPLGCQGNPVLSRQCNYISTCSDLNWVYSLSPSTCPETRKQNKSWTKIGNCEYGVNHSSSEIINCDYNAPVCTSYNYSVWGECLQSGTQSRSVISSYPLGCQGNPVLSRQCNYIPLCTENDWNYTLNPKICPKSEEQTKTWTKIGNCQRGVNHSNTENINCEYFNALVYDFLPLDSPKLIGVNLPHLDGSGYLRGDYVDVLNYKLTGDPLPTPRVQKMNFEFIYQPVNFTKSISPFGTLGYWGYDELSDSGHRFCQVGVYYNMNKAVEYFIKLGFTPQKKVTVALYDEARAVSGYIGDYKIIEPMPHEGFDCGYEGRIEIHEYTHLVASSFGIATKYGNTEQKGLAESFPKYFERAVTNTSRGAKFYYSLNDGGKDDFSIYEDWIYTDSNDVRKLAYTLGSTLWHVRQEIGEEKTDKLVYAVMTKYFAYQSCAAKDLLNAMIKADNEMNNGDDVQVITDVFEEHNISINTC